MNLIKNIIREVIEEYQYPKGGFKSGRGDFQKAGKNGFDINGTLSFGDNSNYDFNQMVRDVPGVKFPRQAVAVNHSNDYDDIDINDETAQEIIQSILSHGEKYNDRYLFANGVARMLYDGEIKPTDFNTLSNICQYLSENPQALDKNLTVDTMYQSKDWEKGISNFYGKSFKELKKEFGTISKNYVKETNSRVKPSSIISSNGYYVYVCYNFNSANSVGSFFTQGMCYLSSDSFFHEHMGDGGILFMFKQSQNVVREPMSRFFNNNKSFNELGIATKIKENGQIIIESITNGNNQSLYNENDDFKHSQFFTDGDLEEISNVIGSINGIDVINFCIQKTKARQHPKYDKILEKSTYKTYLNQYYSNYINTPYSKEIDGLILYKMKNNVSICLDSEKKRVFVITDKGFITCNGKQVKPNNNNIYRIIDEVMSEFYSNWEGFKHNRRNKTVYIDENIMKKLILETLKILTNDTTKTIFR